MKAASAVGIVLAALTLGYLAALPVLSLGKSGGGLSQATLVRIVGFAGSAGDAAADVERSAGLKPRVLLQSGETIILEVDRPYSRELGEAIAQGLSGAEAVSVLPISQAHSLPPLTIFLICLVSFVLVGAVAYAASRRKRAAVVYPLVCMLTVAETLALLSLAGIALTPELLVASMLVFFLFSLTSAVFLLSPVKSQEGMRRVGAAAKILSAGVASGIISVLLLSIPAGFHTEVLMCLAAGLFVSCVNLYWLAGDLLFQPAPKEAVMYHVSF